MDQPVVGARPDQPRLRRTLVNRVDHAAVLHPDVVGGEAAGDGLPLAVVGGQVRADLLPALAAVRGAVDMLAAHIDGVAVVRREEQREDPLEPVAQRLRRPAHRALRPHLHLPELPGSLVVADHDPAGRARSRGARPDDVRVLRVRGGEAALAAADRVPHPAGNPGAEKAPGEGAARAPRRGAVLPVAEDVVGNRVVHGHVVHLGDRKLDLEPGPAPVLRDGDPAVVGDRHPVRVGVVNPHVVVVPARGLVERVHPVGLPRVQRGREGGGQEIGLVGIVRGRGAARVVGAPPGEVAVVGLDRPALAAVVGGPQLAALGLAAAPVHPVHPGPGLPVAGLDEREDPPRVRLAHAERDLPDIGLRQPVSFEAGPSVPAVAGHMEPASRPAAHPAPGAESELPHPGEQDPGVVRVHHQVGGAGLLVHEQHPLPAFPAVGGPVDAALRLRGVGVAERSRIDDVGVRGVDEDPGDPGGRPEAHVGPAFPGVGGLEDAGPDGDIRPDEGLAGARPDDVRVGFGDGQRPDGVGVLVVEHRAPAEAGVFGLPDAAGGGAGVIDTPVARHARHRERPVADRSDVPEVEPAELVGGRLGGRGGGQAGGEAQDEAQDEGGGGVAHGGFLRFGWRPAIMRRSAVRAAWRRAAGNRARRESPPR